MDGLIALGTEQVHCCFVYTSCTAHSKLDAEAFENKQRENLGVFATEAYIIGMDRLLFSLTLSAFSI